MITAIAPRTHQTRAAFGNEKNGKIKITTVYEGDAAKLFGALLTASKAPTKEMLVFVPEIKKGSFDSERDVINLQVSPDETGANYDLMVKAINRYSEKERTHINVPKTDCPVKEWWNNP